MATLRIKQPCTEFGYTWTEGQIADELSPEQSLAMVMSGLATVHIGDLPVFPQDGFFPLTTVMFASPADYGLERVSDVTYEFNGLRYSGDGTALVGEQGGGGGGGATSLGRVLAAAAVTLTSSSGGGTSIPAATTSLAGVMSAAQATLLGTALQTVANDNTLAGDGAGTPLSVPLSVDAGNQLALGADGRLFVPTAAAVALSQAQVENAASVVFGQVSGQRLSQSVAAHESGITFVYANAAARTGGTGYTVTQADIDKRRVFEQGDKQTLWRPTGTAGTHAWVQVGGGSAERIFVSATQIAHGFTAGTPVRQSGGVWVRAQGDDAANVAQGVVTFVSGNDFEVTEVGQVTVTAHGLNLNEFYWLDQAAPGVLTAAQPTSGIAQSMIYVIDANTWRVRVEQAVTVGSSQATTSPDAQTYVRAVDGEIQFFVGNTQVGGVAIDAGTGLPKWTQDGLLDPVSYMGTPQTIAQRNALSTALPNARHIVMVVDGGTNEYQWWNGTAWSAFGGAAPAPLATAVDIALGVGDYLVEVDSTTGPVQVTLPATAPLGKHFKVSWLAGTNPVTITSTDTSGRPVQGDDGLLYPSINLALTGEVVEFYRSAAQFKRT